MKKVLYVIIGLVVVYLIMCMVGPKESKIERTISINQKPEIVKAQLLDFKFFNEKWSPWTEKDPNMKWTYFGEIGKPGYKYDWDGIPDSVGAGTMEFIGVSGDSIKQNLIFKGWDVTSKVHLITVPEGEGSKVTWGLAMPMGFIWRGMGMFMSADKMMGPDFDRGMSKMKAAMESLQPATAAYDVKELEWPEVNYIGTKRQTIELMKLPEFLGNNWMPIMKELEKNKIALESAPTAIYFAADMTTMKFDVAAVFKAPVGAKLKGYENHIYPAGKVLHVAFYGDPNKSLPAHEAMEAYLKKMGAEKAVAIEESVTDPGMEKDTAKWLTNIYYVIKK